MRASYFDLYYIVVDSPFLHEYITMVDTPNSSPVVPLFRWQTSNKTGNKS